MAQRTNLKGSGAPKNPVQQLQTSINKQAARTTSKPPTTTTAKSGCSGGGCGGANKKGGCKGCGK